ncbi:MAG TPA: LPS assembly protein LptD [Solimonas sp.]|nr:LPS assembly protein LptD [Solimonas sp.]
MPLPRRLLRSLVAASLACACPGAVLAQASCPQLTDSMEAPELLLDDNLVLTADDVQLDEEGISKLAGKVKLRQGGKEFTAEALEFDQAQRRVTVRAESVFRNRQLVIRSQTAEFDLGAETGAFNGNSFTLPERAARGTSSRIVVGSDQTAGLDDVRYTTCSPGSNAWYLEAGSIKLDHVEGLGSAHNARLRFFGVPILYAPYFQFPIDNRRRTGLLFPTLGDSGKTGLDFRQPVYVNIAPNYDATLTPRYMSSRGLQLNSVLRYLRPHGEGEAGYEFLGKDRVTSERRTLARFEHRGLINRRLAADARYAEASDNTYFQDLGGQIDISSITHLERSARLTYQAPAAYTLQGLVQDYQTITSNLAAADEPYRRLPQVRIDALSKNSLFDTRLGAGAEYVNFERSNSVQGQRVDLDPYLRYERDQVAWFARSQLDLRYTAYALDGTAPGQSNDAERALPVFSAEYGRRFERFLDDGDLQTVEPRLFYLYVPFDAQDDLPVFDAGEPDFDFTQLFARNRFSGEDRVADANHLALAATARQLDPGTGLVRIAASIGQVYRFEAPRVQLPGSPAPESGATDFIGGLDYAISERWSTSLTTQWSPEEKQFNRTSAGVRYRGTRRRLDLAYRYRKDTLEQADLSGSTPLLDRWRLAWRWRYSLKDSQSIDTVGGVEYETCCWALRTSYRRYIADTDGTYNSGLYLQLELKGLARIGSGFPGLLPQEQERY